MFDAFNLYLEEKHSTYFSFKFGYFSIFSQRGFVLKEIKTVKKMATTIIILRVTASKNKYFTKKN